MEVASPDGNARCYLCGSRTMSQRDETGVEWYACLERSCLETDPRAFRWCHYTDRFIRREPVSTDDKGGVA